MSERSSKAIGKGKEIIAIGDWNVRFHGRREAEEETLGPWTAGRGKEFMEKCEGRTSQATNRELCMDWCSENNLVHMNSQFQKGKEKKMTKRNWNRTNR